MKKLLEIALAILVTVGWWGALYPHLSMIEDTCMVVYETGERYAPDSIDIYFDILKSEPGKLRIKSRLLERHG